MDNPKSSDHGAIRLKGFRHVRSRARARTSVSKLLNSPPLHIEAIPRYAGAILSALVEIMEDR